ncbi:MAG: alpha-amylase family glycosyl hydrolase, partial [Chloroflexota bacterium]
IVELFDHASVQHPWFEASKDPESDKRDWYIWEDENPGFRGPWGQEVWHATRGSHYYGVFWVGMPDLNYENPEVTEAMYGIVDFWLTEMEADGFRLDAIKHMVEDGNLQENTFGTHDWLEDFYAHYKSVEPDAFTVGEAWTSTNQVVDYTGDEVDVAFQFDLAEDVLNSVDVGLPQLYDKSQQEVLAAFESNQYATFITNHDQNRVMSEFDGDFNKGRLAASLLLTTPGIPFVYYGEEIGMTGVKPDEDIRLPMHWSSADSQVGFTTGTPWRPAAQDFNMTSVALQADDPNSLLSHYRNLIHLRNENAALRVGEMSVVESNSNRIYAFLRHLEDEVLLVVMNFDDEPVTAGDYALSLAEGPLTADMTPRQLFGNRPAADLPVSSAGGFEGYIPFEEIPSQSLHIISLQ